MYIFTIVALGGIITAQIGEGFLSYVSSSMQAITWDFSRSLVASSGAKFLGHAARFLSCSSEGKVACLFTARGRCGLDFLFCVMSRSGVGRL